MKLDHISPNKAVRVNQLRNSVVSKGIYYSGRTFDSDPNSLLNIMSRALRLVIDNSIADVYWRTKDNKMVRLSREQFFEFAAAADAYIESTYQQSWALKDEIP